MPEPVTTTIGLYSAIISLAGGLVGASEKIISLRQRILPPPTEDGILVRVAEAQFEGRERKDAVEAVRQVYKTLASAHAHVERERKRQAVSSGLRLVTRLVPIAAVSFGAPLLLQYLGYFSGVVIALGLVAIVGLSFVVGQDAIKIEGLLFSGRVMTRIPQIQKMLSDLSVNSLAKTARNLATALEEKVDSAELRDSLREMGKDESTALTRTFLELYDGLANAVNSIEVYTLGLEFSTAASSLTSYLGTSMNLVIAEAIKVMVMNGSLVAKPYVGADEWLKHQSEQLRRSFERLGVAHRLAQKDYEALWTQDFAELFANSDGKTLLIKQLDLRRHGPKLGSS